MGAMTQGFFVGFAVVLLWHLIRLTILVERIAKALEKQK